MQKFELSKLNYMKTMAGLIKIKRSSCISKNVLRLSFLRKFKKQLKNKNFESK